MAKSVDELRKELVTRIEKSRRIIDGLESHEPFKEFVNDFRSAAQRLDESWQWITDEKVLKEAQLTKMATLSVINALDNYRADIERAGKELDKLNHPDKIIAGDYDGE